MIKVCVGSRNISKIKGVEKAFNYLLGDSEVKGYNVEGTINQPINLDQILAFARYRARKTMEIEKECDFYVGVEAGLIMIKELGYFDVHVACIIDKNGNEYYGFSPAFMVPRLFVDKIISGEFKELEEVVDTHFGTKNIGEKGGLISLLTRGNVLREELVFHSIVAALIPIINRDLYSGDLRS